MSEATEEEDMQKIREVVAEAIQETETIQQATYGAEILEPSATSTARSAHAHASNIATPAAQSRERGELEMGRTPLQGLQDALKRRFGSETLRTSSSNAETTGVGRNVQRRQEAAVLLLRENVLEQRRAGKAPMTAQQQAHETRRVYATGTGAAEATRNHTTPDARYNRPSNLNPRRAGGNHADIRRTEQHRTETTANTPWGLWTAACGHAKDNVISQASITAIVEESRKTQLVRQIRKRDHTDFGKKA
jgi:hypothetical protein